MRPPRPHPAKPQWGPLGHLPLRGEGLGRDGLGRQTPTTYGDLVSLAAGAAPAYHGRMESERRMTHTTERTQGARIAGLSLLAVGVLLVAAAFFAPWFDVYKLNDPTYPFPRRSYGPWTVLQSGWQGVLTIVTWVFALLIVMLALCGLALARARTAQLRLWAGAGIMVWAGVGLTITAFALYAVPFDLSFSWPFLSSDTVYGAYLALAGFLCALSGLFAVSRTAPEPARMA